MAKLFNISLAGQYPPLNNRINHFDRLLAQKIGDGGVITTATGNPVSIVTGKAQNAISTILSYSPKQTGSGDPSPQNIRPIEGWTEANLNGCGKNMCDAVAYEIPANSTWNTAWEGSLTGELTVSFDDTAVTAEVPTAGRFIRLTVDGETKELYFRTQNMTITGTLTKIEVIGSNAYVRASGTLKMQVELGSTSTAYEPYKQGANITESLGGTYYGFSVDLENGTLTVDTMYLSYKWSEFGAKAVLGDYTRGQIVLPYRAVYPPTASKPQKCNIAPYKAAFTEDSLHFYCNTDRLSVFLPNDTDGDTIITAVYELAEPQTITLTPQTVALLAGNNTLWTDGDEITITYKAKR